MNRRDFLRGLIGGVAATAAVRTWPFRVYSFPTNVVRVPRLIQVGPGRLYWAGETLAFIELGTVRDMQFQVNPDPHFWQLPNGDAADRNSAVAKWVHP